MPADTQPQFKPDYFQSAPPPTYDEGTLAQVTLARNQQRNAAIMALGQLVQENQKITLARDELTRHVAEDAAMERYRTADVGLRSAALGQEGDIARAKIGVDYAAQENQSQIAAGQQAGETLRTGMQIGARKEETQAEIGSREKIASEGQAGETARENLKLTSAADLQGQQLQSEERRAQLASDTHLAATKIQADAATMRLHDKAAAEPFEMGGSKWNKNPASARLAAREFLSKQAPYKDGAQIPEDLLAGTTKDVMEAMGFKQQQMDPKEARVRAHMDTGDWFDAEKKAGKTHTGAEFDAKLAENLKRYGQEAPAAAPAGGEQKPALAPDTPAKPEAPFEPQILNFKQRDDNARQIRLLARDLRSTLKNHQNYPTQSSEEHLAQKQAKLDAAITEFKKMHGELSDSEKQQIEKILRGEGQ